MIKVNAMGDACPIPVIKTKNAIREMNGAGQVEVLVDNEIAVQNLTKMAKQKGYQCQSEKISDDEYKVMITVPEGNKSAAADQDAAMNAAREGAARESEGAAGTAGETAGEDAGQTACLPDSRKKKKIVVLRSGKMGEGNDELGAVLMKGFIYALTELDNLPETILLYNGGRGDHDLRHLPELLRTLRQAGGGHSDQHVCHCGENVGSRHDHLPVSGKKCRRPMRQNAEKPTAGTDRDKTGIKK